MNNRLLYPLVTLVVGCFFVVYREYSTNDLILVCMPDRRQGFFFYRSQITGYKNNVKNNIGTQKISLWLIEAQFDHKHLRHYAFNL